MDNFFYLNLYELWDLMTPLLQICVVTGISILIASAFIIAICIGAVVAGFLSALRKTVNRAMGW